MVFQYNALINATSDPLKTEMNDNYCEQIIPQETNTRNWSTEKFSNKEIPKFFDKLRKNHDVSTAAFWKRKLDAHIEKYFNITH